MINGRSKHIERRHNDQVGKEKLLEIKYCKTKLQLIDILTKPLNKARLEGLKRLMRARRLGELN